MPPFGTPIPYAEPLWYSRDKSPYYNDSHRKLRAVVRRYVDEQILPFAFEWENEGVVPDFAFKRHAQLGYLGLVTGLDVPLPSGIKRDDWDEWHTLIVTDELSRITYTGVLWGLGGGNSIGVPPIVKLGTQEQKEKYLPGVADGSVRFCLGITEPDAGSDVSGITTTARIMGDGFIVDGCKKWITNGINANFCTAAVRTGGPGASGISLLIIPLDHGNITRRRMHNSGVHASGSTFLTFSSVPVPLSNLIGPLHGGFPIIMQNFNAERKGIATSSLRLSRICVEDAYIHAMTRETFGKRLVDNAVIKEKFGMMGRAIEPAWAFLEALTWLMVTGEAEGGERIGGMMALLKVVSTRCLELCVREAQQVMGGLGYSRGGKGGRIEAISRDVRVMAVGGGSEEIMSELALREEIKDLKIFTKSAVKESKL